MLDGQPVLSWQTTIVGDPLYRPFAVGFDEQWRHFDGLPARLAGWKIAWRRS